MPRPEATTSLSKLHSQPSIPSVLPLTIPILIDADSDLDGLSDSWEAELGLSSEDPTDVLLDLDGDGIDALGEWEAGTDPKDSASVLAIRWTVEPGGTWHLRIDSQVGRTYYLERSPESGLGNVWETAGEFSGTGGTLELGVLEPGSDASRLYRVRVRRNR